MRFLLGFNSSLYSAGILLGGIQLSSKKLDFLMRCIWQYISLAFNVITLMKVLIFFYNSNCFQMLPILLLPFFPAWRITSLCQYWGEKTPTSMAYNKPTSLLSSGQPSSISRWEVDCTMWCLHRYQTHLLNCMYNKMPLVILVEYAFKMSWPKSISKTSIREV